MAGRNDTRTRTRNSFGKVGVSFPYNDLAYPVIVEAGSSNQNEDKKAMLVAHWEATLYPGAVLTDQGTEPGDNTDNNFREVYETLPGPWLPITRNDTFLGPVQERRRVVKAGTFTLGVFTPDPTQVPSLSATSKTTYEARGTSEIVSWQIEETSGTGLGGSFYGYPIGTEDLFDREKAPFERKTQVVVATGSEVASFVVSAGVATMTEYVPLDGYQPYLLKKIVETFAYPTPLLKDDTFEDNPSELHRTTQLVADTTTAGSLVVSAGTATNTSYQAYNSVMRRAIVETWPVPGTARSYNDVGRRGYTGTRSRRLVDASSSPTVESELIDVDRRVAGKGQMWEDATTYAAGGSPLVSKSFNEFGGLDVETDKFVAPSTTPSNSTWTVQELRHEREKQARLIETVIAAGSSITEIENIDPRVPGSRATQAAYLVLASTTIPADTTTKVYRRIKFPKNPLVRIEIETTYAIPSSFTESKDMGMAFPTLFSSYYSDDLQGTTILSRGGFSVVVPHLVAHSFGTSRVDVAPYQIIENDFVLFSMRFQGLMDAGSAYRTTRGILYTQTYGASTPSKTTYTGLIDTYITVGGGSEIWRAGIFETQTITVKLQ